MPSHSLQVSDTGLVSGLIGFGLGDGAVVFRITEGDLGNGGLVCRIRALLSESTALSRALSFRDSADKPAKRVTISVAHSASCG